jgi:hypothetical protein
MRVWWMLIKNSIEVLAETQITACRLDNRPEGGFCFMDYAWMIFYLKVMQFQNFTPAAKQGFSRVKIRDFLIVFVKIIT